MLVTTILNYVQISEKIATSGQPLVNEFSTIAAADYSAVINLACHDSEAAIPDEGAIVSSHGMSYFQIPVRFEAPKKEQLKQFINLIQVLDNEKIWIHCVMNFRVSAFIYQYLRHVCHVSEAAAKSTIFDFWKPDTVWQELMLWNAEDIGLANN